LIFRPGQKYLRHIDAPKLEQLEKLSRECSKMAERDLFEVTRIMPSAKAEN
jgi:hypothetical protein